MRVHLIIVHDNIFGDSCKKRDIWFKKMLGLTEALSTGSAVVGLAVLVSWLGGGYEF